MTVQSPSNLRLKAAISVSEMARMVNLSRARFYDLVRTGVFLAPVYSMANRRPLYAQEMQEEILLARQTGIGCNGRYVLFYERQPAMPSSPSAPRRPARQERHDLIGSLRSLGLQNVTTTQVDEAMAVTFPNGTAGADEVTVVRSIYRHLRRLGVA
jgi:hypothetical protein